MVPLSTQNHISWHVALNFHLIVYFQASDLYGRCAVKHHRSFKTKTLKVGSDSKNEGQDTYHWMTVANSWYQLLKEKPCLVIKITVYAKMSTQNSLFSYYKKIKKLNACHVTNYWTNVKREVHVHGRKRKLGPGSWHIFSIFEYSSKGHYIWDSTLECKTINPWAHIYITS